MNEREWLTSTDPQAMLDCLRRQGRLSERKARLFAVACCRRIWPWLLDHRSREAVTISEQYADQVAGPVELHTGWSEARTAARTLGHQPAWAALSVATTADPSFSASRHAALAAVQGGEAVWSARQAPEFREEGRCQADLLRDIFPNPFRPLPLLSPSVRTWHDGTVVRLAQAIYEERELPSGHLDLALLGVLADALEEAGVTDADVLGHLRGPGPHVRGCWCVDLLLAKE